MDGGALRSAQYRTLRADMVRILFFRVAIDMRPNF